MLFRLFSVCNEFLGRCPALRGPRNAGGEGTDVVGNGGELIYGFFGLSLARRARAPSCMRMWGAR